MPSLLGATGACPVWKGAARLAEALTDMQQPATDHQAAATHYHRMEVEVHGVSDPAHWLVHQKEYPRVYFSNQHKTLRVAGVGAAEIITRPAALDEAEWSEAFRGLEKAHPRMRFYGGARFDSEATTQQEWSRFGALFFILPLLELQVLARGSRPSSLCVYACVCVCVCARACVSAYVNRAAA